MAGGARGRKRKTAKDEGPSLAGGGAVSVAGGDDEAAAGRSGASSTAGELLATDRDSRATRRAAAAVKVEPDDAVVAATEPPPPSPPSSPGASSATSNDDWHTAASHFSGSDSDSDHTDCDDRDRIIRVDEHGEIPGYVDGSKYAIEPAKTSRSSCTGICGGGIEHDEARFGSSGEAVMHGRVFWRHLECVTARQLANVAVLYGTDDYSVVPGWHRLSAAQQWDARALFDAVRDGDEERILAACRAGGDVTARVAARMGMARAQRAGLRAREERAARCRVRMEMFDAEPDSWVEFFEDLEESRPSF